MELLFLFSFDSCAFSRFVSFPQMHDIFVRHSTVAWMCVCAFELCLVYTMMIHSVAVRGRHEFFINFIAFQSIFVEFWFLGILESFDDEELQVYYSVNYQKRSPLLRPLWWPFNTAQWKSSTTQAPFYQFMVNFELIEENLFLKSELLFFRAPRSLFEKLMSELTL